MAKVLEIQKNQIAIQRYHDPIIYKDYLTHLGYHTKHHRNVQNQTNRFQLTCPPKTGPPVRL